jgi:two-component system response regulator HupR/HoxA
VRTPLRPASGDRGKVLVVDDDIGARTTLHGVLVDDFEVAVADGLGNAEAALARADFDVLLTDLEMPNGSGLTLLKRVETRWPWIIGILLTGHDERAEVRSARDDKRLYRVMRKPYQPEALIDSVRRGVALARLRRMSLRRPGTR